MAQDLAALTNTWMTNPYMFEPSQVSNAFSNYNNAALPWPPTYNGAPVNAATGKPIQSFQDWQAANPGGMNINATPAQPAAAPSSPIYQPQGPITWGPGNMGFRPGQAEAGMLASQTGLSMQAAGGLLNQFGGGQQQPGAGQQGAQQAGGAGAPPNNWQAAINALANPGNPQTMGANVPMVSGSQPAGGVNAAFLNQAGAGQGMNQGFLSALRAIQGR